MRALLAVISGRCTMLPRSLADRPWASSGLSRGCQSARVNLVASVSCEQQLPGTALLAAQLELGTLPRRRVSTSQQQPAAHALAAGQSQQLFTAAGWPWGCSCSCSRQPALAALTQPRDAAAQHSRLPALTGQLQLHRTRMRVLPAAAGPPGRCCCSSSSSSSAGFSRARQQRQQLAAALRAAGVAAGPTTGWAGAPGAAGGSSGSDYSGKRLVDLTPEEKLELLRSKLLDAWGEEPPDLHPGTQRLVCPECGNGSQHEDCFAVTVEEDVIKWHCHRATCGYQGSVYAHGGRWASARDVAAAAGAIAGASRGRGGGQSLFNGGPGVEGPARALRQQQQQLEWKPDVALGSRLEPLTPEMLQWFEQRCISQATLQRNGVASELHYCAPTGRQEPHIAFPYRRKGAIVNIKYRTLGKHFSQTKGGEQIFYGFDDAQGAREVIIVEGEMDKLAVEEALMQLMQQQPAADAAGQGPGGGSTADSGSALLGGVAVLSVPSGAPASSPSGPGNLERKFRYLLNCADLLTSAERIVLAVDSDGPGVLLADELARRIGREKCWKVTWPTGPHDSLSPAAVAAAAAAAAATPSAATPSAAAASAAGTNGTEAAAAGGEAGAEAGADAGDWARKDANEVLMKDGAAVLCAYLQAAQPLPIRGLFRFDEFWPQVYDLYQQGPRGLSWGVSSGWDAVDACYKVVPGELTVVTGLPNMGKSEWLDALAVNLARQQGWRIALCSMENPVVEHGRKIMEKYSGKAFFDADYSRGTTKMDFDEFVDTLLWVDDHFHIIRPPPDQLPTIDYILNLARAAVLRYGIHGLVIDPYNELDHRRPAMFSETEHVSRLLTKIKRFAQHYDVHVWFVAHPRTQRGFGLGGGTAALPPPTMYDISGSANFINKADNGIVVHRPHAGPAQVAEGADPFATQLLVRKVRNKLAGKIGDVTLRYDRAVGSYKDYGS